MIFIGVGGFLGGDLSKTVAAEKETRTFSIKVDGTLAGHHQMTISASDDHVFTVDSEANVSVSRLFIRVYRYTYRGTEVWKDGRLIQLQSKANDNGKSFDVLARAEGDTLRVRVNGQQRTTRTEVWTTTYWRLPELLSPQQALTLLDCDTGKDLHGQVKYLGMQQLTVGGQVQDCAHYQIRGQVHVDVWYDAQKRLVRQDTLDDGYRVLFELIRLDREALLPKP